MQVLMTTDAVGGVFSHCLQLARALGPAGVRVVLASMGRRLSPSQRAEVDASGVELFESEYRLEWMDDPWGDVERAGDWLLQLERELRPHVVHVNGYAHAALPWRAPALLVAHSCVCSWWRAVLGEPAPESYMRYRAAVSRGLGAARVCVAPTRAMLESLTREYGPVPASRVIPNGIALPATEPAAKEPFVLAAGRIWDRAKNIELLELAAPGLPAPVFVAGDAMCPDGRTPAAFHNLRLLGSLSSSALAGWMARAAIFAAPALYEPFGLAILEAATARCALVLGDIPSLRELWGDAALYVDPTDASALSQELERLLADPEQCSRRGLAAAQRARRYGADVMAGRYLALYRSLGGRARPSSRAALEVAR
jgi:glycogen synthase